jgi:hypothetical protein
VRILDDKHLVAPNSVEGEWPYQLQCVCKACMLSSQTRQLRLSISFSASPPDKSSLHPAAWGLWRLSASLDSITYYEQIESFLRTSDSD